MEPNTIGKGRLEAFSDGVIAIIVTIMVLELKIPHEGTFDALKKLGPTFCSYLLSFLVTKPKSVRNWTSQTMKS